MSRSSFDGSGEGQVKHRQGSIAVREYFAPRISCSHDMCNGDVTYVDHSVFNYC